MHDDTCATPGGPEGLAALHRALEFPGWLPRNAARPEVRALAEAGLAEAHGDIGRVTAAGLAALRAVGCTCAVGTPEAPLFRTLAATVVGLPYHAYRRVHAALTPDTAVTLARDPGNPHDPNAVRLHARINGAWEMLGFVKREHAAFLSAALADGRVLGARLLDERFEERAGALTLEAAGGFAAAADCRVTYPPERPAEAPAADAGPLWTMRDGRQVPIRAMEDGHLRSTLDFLVRNTPAYRANLLANSRFHKDWRVVRRGVLAPGPVAFLAEHHESWTPLVEEAHRRGLPVPEDTGPDVGLGDLAPVLRARLGPHRLLGAAELLDLRALNRKAERAAGATLPLAWYDLMMAWGQPAGVVVGPWSLSAEVHELGRGYLCLGMQHRPPPVWRRQVLLTPDGRVEEHEGMDPGTVVAAHASFRDFVAAHLAATPAWVPAAMAERPVPHGLIGDLMARMEALGVGLAVDPLPAAEFALVRRRTVLECGVPLPDAWLELAANGLPDFGVCALELPTPEIAFAGETLQRAARIGWMANDEAAVVLRDDGRVVLERAADGDGPAVATAEYASFRDWLAHAVERFAARPVWRPALQEPMAALAAEFADLDAVWPLSIVAGRVRSLDVRSATGGLPYLPDGAAWPVGPGGVPLTHILRVFLSELPEHPLRALLPAEGVLNVFFDHFEQRYTGEVGEDETGPRDHHRIVFNPVEPLRGSGPTPAPDGVEVLAREGLGFALGRTAVPDWWSEDDPEEERLEGRAGEVLRVVQFFGLWGALGLEAEPTDEAAAAALLDRLVALLPRLDAFQRRQRAVYAAMGFVPTDHSLFGVPEEIQGQFYNEPGAGRVFLLQVGGCGPGFEWGDGGTLTWLMDRDTLARRAFGRATLDFTCH